MPRSLADYLMIRYACSCKFRDHSLSVSWAVFPRAHTGDNDPLFLSDTFDVKVDSTNWAVQQLPRSSFRPSISGKAIILGFS